MKTSLKCYVFIGFFAAFGPSFAGAYDDFFTAVRKDDAWAISQLLTRGFDPNTVDLKGQPALMVAIAQKSYQAASVLAMSPKAQLNQRNAAGESPLMMAALDGQAKFAAQLIALGADVNQTGWTPLHYAATKGDVATVRLLLDEHAYVDAESPNGTTPLMMAAQYGSTEAVRLLLEEGAQASQKNQQGLTALDFAKRGVRPDAIAILSALARPALMQAPAAASPAAPLMAPAARPVPEPAAGKAAATNSSPRPRSGW